jgi:hypothetical protein
MFSKKKTDNMFSQLKWFWRFSITKNSVVFTGKSNFTIYLAYSQIWLNLPNEGVPVFFSLKGIFCSQLAIIPMKDLAK